MTNSKKLRQLYIADRREEGGVGREEEMLDIGGLYPELTVCVVDIPPQFIAHQAMRLG